MGNSSSNQTLTVTKIKDPKAWQLLIKTSYCEVLKNVLTGQQAQQYTLILDSKLSITKQFEIYEYRKKQNSNLVSVINVQKHQSQYMCSGIQVIKVRTERIIYRLSDIETLNLNEALYVIRESLYGFKIIMQFDYGLRIQPNLICVNSKGKIKVWLNQHLQYNHPQPINQYQKSFDQNYLLKIESIMVEQILKQVFEKLKGKKVPKKLLEMLQLEKIKSFTQTINLINNYCQQERVLLPENLKITTLQMKTQTSYNNLLISSNKLGQVGSKIQNNKLEENLKPISATISQKSKDEKQKQVIISQNLQTIVPKNFEISQIIPQSIQNMPVQNMSQSTPVQSIPNQNIPPQRIFTKNIDISQNMNTQNILPQIVTAKNIVSSKLNQKKQLYLINSPIRGSVKQPKFINNNFIQTPTKMKPINESLNRKSTRKLSVQPSYMESVPQDYQQIVGIQTHETFKKTQSASTLETPARFISNNDNISANRLVKKQLKYTSQPLSIPNNFNPSYQNSNYQIFHHPSKNHFQKCNYPIQMKINNHQNQNSLYVLPNNTYQDRQIIQNSIKYPISPNNNLQLNQAPINPQNSKQNYLKKAPSFNRIQSTGNIHQYKTDQIFIDNRNPNLIYYYNGQIIQRPFSNVVQNTQSIMLGDENSSSHRQGTIYGSDYVQIVGERE